MDATPQRDTGPVSNVSEPRSGTAIVEVIGEHDLSTRDETRELFARLLAENELLVVDLTEAQFIDSSFLNNLKIARDAADEHGRTVLLQVGTEPIVKRLLELTHFLTHFDHVASRQEALAWVDTA